MTFTTLIHSRKSLIDHIDEVLTARGFERAGDTFTRDFIVRQPGSRIIINGQMMETPGQEFHMQFCAELMGTGQVLSEDGRTEDFELINFSVRSGEQSQGISLNIYYDENQEFDKMLHQLFGL